MSLWAYCLLAVSPKTVAHAPLIDCQQQISICNTRTGLVNDKE